MAFCFLFLFSVAYYLHFLCAAFLSAHAQTLCFGKGLCYGFRRKSAKSQRYILHHYSCRQRSSSYYCCCFHCCCCFALGCAAFSRFYDFDSAAAAPISSEAIETDFADAYFALQAATHPSPQQAEPLSLCTPQALFTHSMKIIFRYVIWLCTRVCLRGIGLPWFTQPQQRRHFWHHYLHSIECSSTLSYAPGRRSKSIKHK